MSALKHLFCFVSLTAAVACGSTSAAGGNTTPGGTPGKPCIAATAPVGCYVEPGSGANTVVSCPADVSPATWVAGETCGAGMHCTVKTKTEAACVANPVTVVNDTVSGGADTSKGDTSAESACVAAKCANETNACMTNPKCTTFMTCLSACKDQTCQNACAAPLKTDTAATAVVQAIFQCSVNAAQACAGGSDAGSTDTGAP